MKLVLVNGEPKEDATLAVRSNDRLLGEVRRQLLMGVVVASNSVRPSREVVPGRTGPNLTRTGAVAAAQASTTTLAVDPRPNVSGA